MWQSRDNTNKPKEAGHLVKKAPSPVLASRGGTLQGYPSGHPKAAQALLTERYRSVATGDTGDNGWLLSSCFSLPLGTNGEAVSI